MTTTFDAAAIEQHGWRQGAILGVALTRVAKEHAPAGISVADGDWLIVTSHDCDVVNGRLKKEPVVEVLRAEVVTRRAPDKQEVWGRNPRVIQIAVEDGSASVVLSCRVHERWTIPRETLSTEAPMRVLDAKLRRLIAEWLAKRYIRAAFPTAFDGRWRARLRDWTSLLARHSRWVQGVYLRLSPLAELDPTTPYKCHLIVAVPAKLRTEADWAAKRDQIDREIDGFWKQFGPAIECAGVDVLGTDELTLAEIEPYQRFDADWVSFSDDTVATPLGTDMAT